MLLGIHKLFGMRDGPKMMYVAPETTMLAALHGAGPPFPKPPLLIGDVGQMVVNQLIGVCVLGCA